MTFILRRLLAPAALAGLMLAALPAAAHHPMGGAVPSTLWHGLASGLAHPVIGPDHLAFLMAIGLIAGLAGWTPALPVLFVLASLCGVAAGWLGVLLPGVELLVAATVVVAGLLLWTGRQMPTAAWAGLFALAGAAHGLAYAEAMIGAEATPVAGYLVGLAVIQSAIAGGLAVLARGALGRSTVPRIAGAAAAVVGVAALAGLLPPG